MSQHNGGNECNCQACIAARNAALEAFGRRALARAEGPPVVDRTSPTLVTPNLRPGWIEQLGDDHVSA